MMIFRNLKLAPKLMLSFVALLLLTAGLGLFSVVQLDRVNRATVDLTQHWMPAERLLLDMRYQLYRYRGQIMLHLLADTPEEMAIYDKSMPLLWVDLLKNYQAFDRYADTARKRELFAGIKEDLDLYEQETAKIIVMSHAMQTEEGARYLRGEPLRIIRAINT